MSASGASNPSFPANTRTLWWWFFAVAAIVAGIRLVLMSAWAGDAPYLDDWNGTGWLHIHAAESSWGIPWAWLVYPHADHLLVMPRLFSLAVAALNGAQWDVRAELMMSALLWGAFAGGLTILGARSLRGRTLMVWAGLVIVAEAVPHAWENLLWAFQVAFVLLIGFSLLAIRWLTTSKPFSPWWFAGLACGVAACLSQASGMLAFAVAGTVLLIELMRPGRTRGIRAWIALVTLAVVAVAAAWVIPSAPWMTELHAHDFKTWYRAAVASFAWPWNRSILIAAVLWLPGIIFVSRSITRRPGTAVREDRFWLGAIIWCIAMGVASAWARGSMLALGFPPSRYGDVLVIGALANTFLILRWANSGPRPAPPRVLLAAVWVSAAIVGIGACAERFNQTGTPATTINQFSRRDFTASRALHVNAVREYLRTKDPAVLSVQPPIYPVNAHTAELIDRLRNAHRWPATLDIDPTRSLPLLSYLARTAGVWAWGLIFVGVGLGIAAGREGRKDVRG